MNQTGGPGLPQNRHHAHATQSTPSTATMKNSALPFLLAGSIACVPNAHSGEPAPRPGPDTVLEKKSENPLSFLDGKVVFDLHEKLRFEARHNNFDFNDSVNAFTDDAWLLQKFRLGLTLQPTPWFKAYVQAQDAREIDSDRPNIPGALAAEGDDNFDLYQGYLEFSNYKVFPLGLKVGRQILTYGDERLVGPLDWNNFSRTFDAVKLRLEQPGWSVDLFTSTPAVVSRDSFNTSDLFNGTETGRNLVFSGIHFHTDAVPWGSYEAYSYVVDQALGNTSNLSGQLAARVFTGNPAERSDFVTLGMRAKGDPKKLHGFEFDVEANYQTGTVRDLDLQAFAAHAGAGYNFEASWKPRLWLDYTYGSGDRNPADGKIETFQNLFPTNHKFYGIMDLTAMQNMHHGIGGLRVNPSKSVTINLDYHAFFAASTDDVWYRANGLTAVRPLNAAARNADPYRGSEIDLVATWKVSKNLQLQSGYAHFFAGNYLADTGASDDADFGYLQATFNF